MKNTRFTSNGFGISGALMVVAGILMMVAGRVAVGAVFWASANCMFLAARHFAKAAEGKEQREITRRSTRMWRRIKWN